MLRVPLESLAAGERAIGGETARYVTRVHRLAAGDRFVAFDPAARLEADAEIVRARPLVVRLQAPRAARLVATRAITLVQSATRGNKLDAVVRDATELGATRVVIAASARSTARSTAGGRPDRRDRWERIAVEAARQCGRGDAPEVLGPLAFDEALALGASGLRLVLHPLGAEGFAEAVRRHPPDAPATIVVGPEGGLSDEELALALDRGYRLARLGAFVMRTETACAAALGALAALS